MLLTRLITVLAAGLLLPKLVFAETATFAGGCFWCMEPPFEKLSGVKSVVSGFMGGDEANPTYKQVASGATGHREVVQIDFDPEVISYEELLQVFWRNVDPTDEGGQFVDRGHQYSTAIFYHSQSQENQALESKRQMDRKGPFKSEIVTPVLEAKTFYAAEDEHQDYYKKKPVRYKFYRYNSGRDKFIDATWGDQKDYSPKKPEREPNAASGESMRKTYSKPSDEEIKKKLNPIQFKVTQKDGTEPAFNNEYWDNKEEGIYVDIVSGEPLFSSTHKYDSGTGWPSFYQPLEKDHIVEKEDRKLFSVRTEVRSKYGDSHLGHVFSDGPEPTGLRYCMNSAALRFIPKSKLKAEGYEEYQSLFE